MRNIDMRLAVKSSFGWRIETLEGWGGGEEGRGWKVEFSMRAVGEDSV